MQELEKILEEIEKEQRSYEADHAWNYAKGLEYAASIVRKHMNSSKEMRMKIRDNETGEVFEYGTNIHLALRISENGGCLTFENLQNGDGSLESGNGGCSFVLDDGKTPEESSSPDAVNGATYANIGGFHRENTKNEEDILKFYYCESEDDYYLGQRVQNMYYAKYEPGGFTWFMSRYLPWGTDGYPSEPKEIPFMEWIEGVIRKHMNDGWIPVEERLPEVGKYVLGTTKSGEVLIYRYGWNSPHSKKMFFHLCGAAAIITAWMPCPDPYRPERRTSDD